VPLPLHFVNFLLLFWEEGAECLLLWRYTEENARLGPLWSKDLSVDERILNVKVCNGEDFIWLNIQYSGGLLWRGSKPSGSLQFGEFLDWHSNYQLMQVSSAAFNSIPVLFLCIAWRASVSHYSVGSNYCLLWKVSLCLHTGNRLLLALQFVHFACTLVTDCCRQFSLFILLAHW